MQNAIISAQELWEKSNTEPKPHLLSPPPKPPGIQWGGQDAAGIEIAIRASFFVQKQSCILGAALGMQHLPVLHSWAREGGGAV
jgi:hypothetical protein